MPLEQSSRLVSDIATAVKRQFGDESGTQITDADIIRWVNQGSEQIAISENIKRTNISTPSVTGQNQYTFPSQNIIQILAIFYKGVPLQSVSFEQAQNTILENLDASTVKSAQPTNWYEWGDSIFLYPTPSGSGDTINLYVTLRPVQITSLNDTLNIPDTYYNPLLQYVMGQAYKLDDEFDKAQFEFTQMETSLDRLDPAVSNQLYSTITISPEDQ
jgi:hypothetical protein